MPLERADFDFVSTLVMQRSGIVLEPAKNYLVEARLSPLAKQHGLASVSELVGRMRQQPLNGLHQKVVEAMTTNETSFFRDIAPFDALRKVVMPHIIQRRERERTLRIWCGASSTGQEPYTIAMILLEHFAPVLTWDVRIIATDLSADVLARARAGRYSQLEVNRGLPAPLLIKYFQHQGMEWQIKEPVRRLVEFRQLNLLDSGWGVGPADIVFLRNVLIYFDVPTKRTILKKIQQVLRPDGYLFLGGAETTINLDDRFERVPLERSGAYRLRNG